MNKVWILITYFMVEIQNYDISANTKLNLNFILDSECTHECYWEITSKLFSMCEGKVFQQCKTWNIHFDIFAWKNFQISKLFSAMNKHRPRTYWPTPLGHLYTHRAFAYPDIFCRNKKILFPLILRLVIKIK